MLSSRPRVLLADDYPDMVTALSRLLAQDCEIVGNVADGSALLETALRLAISKIPTNIRVELTADQKYDFVIRKRDIERFDRASGRRVNGGGK